MTILEYLRNFQWFPDNPSKRMIKIYRGTEPLWYVTYISGGEITAFKKIYYTSNPKSVS